MTAITLAVVSSALLTYEPSIDHIVALSVITLLSDEIGDIALKIEKESFEAAVAVQPDREPTD